jgi:hypothetical protein
LAFRRIVGQRQAAWIEDAGAGPKGFEESAASSVKKRL